MAVPQVTLSILVNQSRTYRANITIDAEQLCDWLTASYDHDTIKELTGISHPTPAKVRNWLNRPGSNLSIIHEYLDETPHAHSITNTIEEDTTIEQINNDGR